MPLQIRRGTNAERENMTIPLAPGEPLYTTDQGFLYIGNGTTPGGVQVTGYGDENAVDAVGAALVAGEHQNIQFIYGQTQDLANRIDAVIDLSVYSGEISAEGIRAPILGTNDFELFNSITNDVNLNGVISSNISPKESGLYDLGSELLSFKDLYLDNSAWIGSAQITAFGTAINLPAGTTVNGLPIGSGDGIVEGSNYRINIIGEDSGLLVDSLNGQFFGNLTGDVVGSVFSDGSTMLVDGVDGVIRGNYNNGTLSINNNSIVSTGPSLPGQFSDAPIILGDDQNPNTIVLKSTSNFGIFTGITDGTSNSAISMRISRGTLDNPLTIISGDGLAFFEGQGYNGTEFISAGVFGLFTDLTWDGIPGANGEIPGAFGAITIDSNGNQNILEFNSKGVLSVPVLKAASYTTGSEPSAPEEGWIIFDTTSKQFKGWNGTSWIILG